jgi:hypothetical protein
MSSVLGLPIHALVVHFAVVLVPVSAFGSMVTGWRSQWRRSYALPVALLAVAGAAACLLATSSGEQLQDSLRQAARAAGTRASFGEHPEEGDTARLFAVVFACAACGLWAIEHWGARLRLQAWVPAAAYIATSGLAIVAVVTVAVAGHSGAALVWKDLGTFAGRR